jgi:ATP-dependent DNA ligase
MHIPIIPMKLTKFEDLNLVRHGLRRRSSEAVYELDPIGIRTQIHYSKNTPEKLNLFNSKFQVINADSFGLYDKLLQMLEESNIQDCILDSKIAIYNTKDSTFIPVDEYMLNQSLRANSYITPILYVFDLMRIDGLTLIGTDIENRKELLKANFSKNNEFLHVSDDQKVSINTITFEDEVKTLSEHAVAKG